MPLIPLRPLLETVDKYHFAQGAFNVNAVAQAKAAIEVHEMFRSAAILQGADLANGFMGGRTDFQNATLEDKKIGAKNIADAVKKYAENSPIPVVLHLDHGKNFDSCKAAIEGGYTSVMIDGSKLDFEGNIAETKRVADVARALNIPCEAELGKVGGKEDDLEAEADTNVTDEEANERGYTMMTISTTSHQDDSGNTVEYTDDEKKQLKETANKIEDAVKNGKTLEDAAKDEDQQTTTGAYASDDSTLDTSVKKALDDLKEGETSDVIETDSALYIVRLDSETDKDATEKNRQNIIDKRKSDHYNEVLEGWQKKDGWKVNKKNVAKISFKNSLTQQDPNASTETQTSTETQNAESTQ